MKPDEILKEGGKTFEAKRKEYGEGYLKYGKVMHALFPDGLKVSGEHDFNRLGVFLQMVSKMIRISENFQRGGHIDSDHDLMVYSAMLESLERNKPEPFEMPTSIKGDDEVIEDAVNRAREAAKGKFGQ